jgi:hypothetical protein
MQKHAPDVKTSRLEIIWTGDPNVAADPGPPVKPTDRDETEDEAKARKAWRPPSDRYEASLERKDLEITGPVRTYHLRPMRRRERLIFQELTEGGALWSNVSYSVLGAFLTEVTGPYPVAERTIRLARTRDPVLGIDMIGPNHELWDDGDAFPEAAVLHIPLVFLQHQGAVTITGPSDDDEARRADPGN